MANNLAINNQRNYSFLDKVLITLDQAHRALLSQPSVDRVSPAEKFKSQLPLSSTEKRHSAGLMRINHAGEICAQALYQGQALMAKTEPVKQSMEQAALEENDHLAWCYQRLLELNSRASYLAAFLYIMSFSVGVCAGFAGDKWSLGFVVETERQVIDHLSKHLKQLPLSDVSSAKILEQMREDEADHASNAMAAGAEELPQGIKLLMHGMAKLMTMTTYWL